MCNGAHAQYSQGQNLGYYIPPCLKQNCRSVLGTRNEAMKQGGVSLFHGGFILPCGLIGPKVLPLHFQLENSLLPNLYFSFVQNVKGLWHKIPFRFHL